MLFSRLFQRKFVFLHIIQTTITMGSFSFQEFAGDANKVLGAIREYAVSAGRTTTKMMLELYYVMVDKNTTNTDKLLIGAALAYQVLPKDLLPKSKFGLLGYFDNAAALYFAYKKVKGAVTPEIEAKVEATLDNWFGEK